MRLVLTGLLALVVAGSACRTRPFDDADGGADGPLFDLSGRPDGDALNPQCVSHTIEFVPLTSIEQADEGPFVTLGRAIRVRVGIPLRLDCDVLGDVHLDVQVGDATDFARISARVWRGSGPCGPPKIVTRTVVVSDLGPLSNPRVMVRDGAPGGTLGIEIRPGSPAGSSCNALSIGAACEHDCQCSSGVPGTLCIPNAMSANCAISCSGDTECPAAQPRCRVTNPVTPSVNFQCDANEGCCAQSCPFGQACDTTCVCRPLQTPFGGSCRCDRDCASGQLCTSDGACVQPCTVFADCPAAFYVACVGGVCTPAL